MELTLDELVFVSSAQHLDNKAVVYDNGKDKCCMTYHVLLSLCSKLTAFFSEQFTPGEVIGLCLKSDQYIPVILLSILRCHTAFYNMDQGSTEFTSHILEEIGARFVIVHKELSKKWKTILSSRRHVTELPMECLDSYVMLKCESAAAQPHQHGLAYCITTSGTTGRPKIVNVPHACIVPNVTHLREIFSIVPNDIVLLTSTLTFDPSIVEIFMTLSSGACLLIVPKFIKMTPDLLLTTVHLRNQVTVIQLTPTLLLRFNIESLPTTLLGDNSVLRVMALGGEKFPPLSYIHKIKSPGNRTRFYDLYGTTEVSCWSTCNEVKEEELRSASSIPLGPCLNNTSLEVRDPTGKVITEGVGELFIGGTQRQCIIGNEELKDRENGLLMRATGDIVEIKTDSKIYYIGRKDRQTKRNGKRIDLEEIKLVASQLEGILQCETILTDNRLVVFAVLNTHSSPESFGANASDVIKKCLAKCLSSQSVPDDVVIVNNLPMTKHGKVNLKELEDIYTQEISNKFSADPIEFLTQRWKELLGLESPIADNANFISLGGNSLKALYLLKDLEHVLNRSFPELLDIILQKTFENIKDYISPYKTDLCQKPSKEMNKDIDQEERSLFPNKNISLDIKRDDINVNNKTTKDMNKHPSDGCKRKQSFEMKNTKLFKADHVFCASVSRGSKITRTTSTCSDEAYSPGDAVTEEGCVCLEACISEGLGNDVELVEKWRYETGKCVDASPLLAISSTVHDSNAVFIGSHSHTMCAIRLGDGKQLWEITLPDRIESSACLSLCGNFVIVGCYDGKVYCLKANSGDLWWTHDTGSNVKSSPTVDTVTGLVYIGSHSQALYCLDVASQRVIWENCLQSGSIFSSPAIWYDPHYVFVGTLGGKVFAVSADSGDVVWKVTLGKPVFSSLAVCQTGVCVGCTDNRLYFLSHTGQQLWSFITDGPIFSSPVIFYMRYLPDGCANSCIQKQLEDPKRNVESNHGNQLIVFGCHDNYVYCLTMQGDELWKVKTDSSVYSSPFVSSFCFDNTNDLFTNYATSEENLCNCFLDNKICLCHHDFELRNNDVRNSDHQKENLTGSLNHNIQGKSALNAIDRLFNDQIGANPFTTGSSSLIVPGTQSVDNIIGSGTNVMEPVKSRARIPVVVFTSSKGILYIVNSVTGKILSTKDLPYEVFSSVIVYDNTIVVGCRDNYVYCFKVQ